MKYLDILKEYDRAIVAESRKLDEIYAKLVGESCTCGKCEECKAREEADGEEVKEGCDRDKRMTEFSEGEKEDGKSDKEGKAKKADDKMVSPVDFFKDDKKDQDSTDDTQPADGEDAEEVPADKPKKADEALDDAKRKEIMSFFGDADKEGDDDANAPVREDGDDEKLARSASEVFATEGEDESDPSDGSDATEPDDASDKEKTGKKSKENDGFDDNKRMSAADLFSEGDDGKKCEDGECEDDDCKKQEKVDEGDERLTMKEIMAKESEGKTKPEDDTDGDEEIPASEPEDKADADEEADKDEKKSEEDEGDEGPVDEAAEEERCLNESIQAITKFVKANRKFFG